MKSAIIAVAAFAASAAASVGSAVVINSCDYSVAMQNVPAEGGGQTEVDETLKSGDTYTQTWTALTNGAGWSMKLWPITGSNTADTNNGDIMQYEYTYDPVSGDWEDTIWFDLSDVNGNPWNGNWEISADGNCDPKQQAYMYATDDAYGEQSCDCNSTVTVTLCSGDNASSPSSASSVAASTTVASSTSSTSAYSSTPTVGDGSSTTSVESSTSSVESSTEASTTAAASTTSAVATSASSSSAVATSTTRPHGHGYVADNVVATPSPTTLATLVSTTSDGMVVVTDVAYTTVVATTTVLDKRSEHMHKREHLHQHAARHPHARQ